MNAVARRTIASKELDWRTDDNKFTLHFRGSRAMLSVIPDAVHADMWRISHRGCLSDMVNLTRAKDAALTWGLSDLNRSQDSPSEAPYVRLNALDGRGCENAPINGGAS